MQPGVDVRKPANPSSTRSTGFLARHYGFTAEPACALHADRELDFIINYDTCLRRGFGRQVKYRLGREAEAPEEYGLWTGWKERLAPGSAPGLVPAEINRRSMEPVLLTANGHPIPDAVARSGLGTGAPARLAALGNLDLLAQPKVALFCSPAARAAPFSPPTIRPPIGATPGRCVISGFHSPVEKECLRILLRGPQPIIICPARSLENLRLPADWKDAMAAGRLLILSCFPAAQRRATAELAARRNEFVAASRR